MLVVDKIFPVYFASVNAVISSPIGALRLETDGKSITMVEFVGHKRPVKPVNVLLKKCAKELSEYFTGKRTKFTVPVKPEGTPFQRAVWKAMSKVKHGNTTEYGVIAKMIRRPLAVRAVGTACGMNPVAVIVPCHRVLSSTGLGGYNGGLKRKLWLLHHEKPLKKGRAGSKK